MKYLKLFENYINEGITFNIKDFGNETSIDANGNVTIYHRPDLYTILDICHAFKHVIFMKKLVGTIKCNCPTIKTVFWSTYYPQMACPGVNRIKIGEKY
jgi:hypothetical protein